MANSKDFFRPTQISDFDKVLRIDARYTEGSYPLSRNIMYSLQYLQYIQNQLDSGKFTSVIYIKLYKTYIVEALGIIEALFTCLLKANGKWAKDNYLPIIDERTNEFIKDGKHYRLQTVLLERTDCNVKRLDFETILNKVSQNKLIEINGKAFGVIKNLKALRNKVHLHLAETSDDTDWNSFSKTDYLWARYTLFIIMTNSLFIRDSSQAIIYDFLELTADEIKAIKVSPVKDRKSKKKDDK